MGSLDLPGQSALAGTVQDALASFASPFTQSDRLFTLGFAEGSGIAPDLLLPHHLRGIERISGTYLYQVEVLSANAYVEAKDILGQAAEIAIQLADGNERLVTGVVTAFGPIAADGGMARYALHLEPCLAVLAHRFNACVRQDMAVPDILKDVFERHQKRNPVVKLSFQVEFRLSRDYPVQSYCNQYESDLHFVERLMAEHGMFYFFEFRRDDEYPAHTMVIADDPHTLKEGLQPTIRFAGTHATESEDTMTQWGGLRRIQPGMVRLTSFDYKSVSISHANEESAIDQGSAGSQLASTLEDFDPRGHYYASGGDSLDRHATLRQEAHDFLAKQFSGASTVRSAAAGTTFELSGHDVHDQDYREQRQFVIVSMVCEAQNNFLQQNAAASSHLLEMRAPVPELLAPWFGNGQSLLENARVQPYRNLVSCVRHGVPIRARYAHTDYAKPTAPGPMTATVVGPPGEEIYTDELGRIKIEYDWQLPQNHPDGAAERTEKSSTWVRVVYPSAGAQWGTQYIPRINQEVMIEFLHGDIDRPVCTGVLYNGTHQPPAFSGAGSLPANKALSGVKTKEVDGNQYNELLFDDTKDEVRAKFSSEHAKTQLNLGYIIHPRASGKGEPRGNGFELRTDASGAIRAAQGLFLTTEAQPVAAGKQLARDHAESQLDAALTLAKSLGEVATKQSADTMETGPEKIDPDNVPAGVAHSGHLQHHLDALRAWEAGTNTDKDGKTAKEEPGRQPIMVMSAPAGIVSVTGQNQALAAGANLDLVAQRDTNQTTGRRWLHNVGQHISLFVNGIKDKVAMKLIAAQGKIQLQAQSDSIEATADKDVTITANKGKVVIAAKDEILLTAGGGYIRLKDGNIEIHCPGKQSQKAASFALTGPERLTMDHPAFPKNLPTQKLVFNVDQTPQGGGTGWAGMPFKLYADGALLKEGVLDKETPLAVDHTVPVQKYKMELANGLVYHLPVVTDYANPAQGELANLGFLKHEAGKAPDTGATPPTASAREAYFNALNGQTDTDAA
jgi:type VI secretion system secreted protein VgrG